MEDYTPISGRTYSLFGGEEDTREFYGRLGGLLDELLPLFNGVQERFLKYIRQEGRDQKNLRRISGGGKGDPEISLILRRGNAVLSEYLGDIEGFIRTVGPYRRIRDRELLTGREQYILLMLEIELLNRMNVERQGLIQDCPFTLLPEGKSGELQG